MRIKKYINIITHNIQKYHRIFNLEYTEIYFIGIFIEIYFQDILKMINYCYIFLS